MMDQASKIHDAFYGLAMDEYRIGVGLASTCSASSSMLESNPTSINLNKRYLEGMET